MDCNTARQLLPFSRPHAGDLAPADADALEGHLAGCPECEALAHGERRLDDCLGQAMRRVDVPDRLRQRLLDRLEAQRGDWYRRRFAHGLRAVAAAAAVLLVAWGWWQWQAARPVPLDVHEALGLITYTRIGADDVRAALKDAGIAAEPPPPDQFNYALLAGFHKTTLPGYPNRPLLRLDFQRRDHPTDRVIVFVVSSRQFDLPSLQPVPPDPAYRYRLEILPPHPARYAYLVFYTGEDWDWLRPAPRS